MRQRNNFPEESIFIIQLLKYFIISSFSQTKTGVGGRDGLLLLPDRLSQTERPWIGNTSVVKLRNCRLNHSDHFAHQRLDLRLADLPRLTHPAANYFCHRQPSISSKVPPPMAHIDHPQ
jgi:hypothetical protein